MGIERLERDGFLLPEEARGELPFTTTVNRAAFLLVAALALASCAAMLLGGGRLWTWVGGLAYLLSLGLFLWLALRAVREENARVRRLLRRTRRPPRRT